jgi:hypothetical protein
LPDRRIHRGPHPDDQSLFAQGCLSALRAAEADYAWLLSCGYAENSALKLVGDRHRLVQRQRVAVARSACSDDELAGRRGRERAAAKLAGELLIDGFNVLVTVEAALAGGVILVARDGCFRDLASIHGTYRRAAETDRALELIGETLHELQVPRCRWLLDSPVSNSGRLAHWMRQVAQHRGWPWTVELVPNPDAVLAIAAATVATADSVVLDRCGGWFNLARQVVERRVSEAWLVGFTQP